MLLGLGVGTGIGLNNLKAAKVSAATRTYQYVNQSSWSEVWVYAWNSSNESQKNAGWPGEKITNVVKQINNKDVYSFSFTNDAFNKVIFNNNSGTQTGNLDIPADGSVYIDGNWATPHSWGICGQFNGASWADDVETDNAIPFSEANATITVDLKIGDTFKFRADGSWDTQLNGEQIASQNSSYFDVDGQNAIVKDLKGGTYTFSINWKYDTYGNKSYSLGVTNYVPDGETNWKMVGNGSKWTGDFVYNNGLAMQTVSSTSTEVKILEVNLQAGDKFKFTDNSKWFGWSNIKTDSPLYGSFTNDGYNNIVVNSGHGGVYDFFIDTSLNDNAQAIYVTSDNYIALDEWARLFVEAEDLCNGSGAEWADFAESYGDLDDAVKALFASNKVDAKQNGTYIERAAYRYEYGVSVANQSAFAEAQRPKAGFASKYSSAIISKIVSNNANFDATIVIVVSTAALLIAGGYFLLKRRKAD